MGAWAISTVRVSFAMLVKNDEYVNIDDSATLTSCHVSYDNDEPTTAVSTMSEAPAQLPRKRERTRSALIEAAIGVLAEKGLESTSIDDLMRGAGMARGTFYNYFQTRDDVVRAVADFIHGELHRCVLSRVAPDWDDDIIVACVCYGFIRYALDHPSIGWTLVRLGGAKHWVSGDTPHHCVDGALQRLLGGDEALLVGQTYVEGVVLMLLRRLLEQRITLAEAERVLGLAWRGLGVRTTRLKKVLDAAQRFVAQARLND